MTTREEITAFKQHRLWAKTDAVISMVNSAGGRSATDRETLSRVLAVLKYLKSFRAIEPYLFPINREAQVESLVTQLDAMESQISGWDQDAAMVPTTISQLDSTCDDILNRTFDFKWPTVRKGRENVVADAADAYRSVADNSLQGMDEDLVILRESVVAVKEEVKSLQTLAEESATQMTEAVGSLDQARDALSENAQNSLQIELKRVAEVAKKQRDDLNVESDRLIDGLKTAFDTGNELVKKVADQSVGGGYLGFARKKTNAYRLWNAVGGSAVLVAFIFLVIIFIGPLMSPQWIEPTSGTENALFKIGITVSLAAFATYAFREAGKQQRQSLEATYRALDVIALPPFSRDLDEEQQRALRYLMGERLFGSSVESASNRSHSESKNNNFTLSIDPGTAKNALDLIKAAKDS